MKAFRAIVCAVVGWAAAAGGLQAAETVWSALVLGQKEAAALALEDPLKAHEAALKKVFGYEGHVVIGSESRRVESGGTWLVPGKDFSVRVEARTMAGGGFDLQFALFQGNRMLVESSARLQEGTPLFVRGPQYGEGQLILVFIAR